MRCSRLFNFKLTSWQNAIGFSEMIKDRTKYSKKIIRLHWVTVVLMLGQMITGTLLRDTDSLPAKTQLSIVHFSCGILVLMLSLARLYFFFADPRPGKPEQLKAAHQKWINAIHAGFYAVLLLLGLTGLISVAMDKFFLLALKDRLQDFQTRRNPILVSHFALTKVFILLFILHVVGFFRHWLVYKENRLKAIS